VSDLDQPAAPELQRGDTTGPVNTTYGSASSTRIGTKAAVRHFAKHSDDLSQRV
jgi:hypothetical protein